jgi:hypothetical protein
MPGILLRSHVLLGCTPSALEPSTELMSPSVNNNLQFGSAIFPNNLTWLYFNSSSVSLSLNGSIASCMNLRIGLNSKWRFNSSKSFLESGSSRTVWFEWPCRMRVELDEFLAHHEVEGYILILSWLRNKFVWFRSYISDSIDKVNDTWMSWRSSSGVSFNWAFAVRLFWLMLNL